MISREFRSDTLTLPTAKMRDAMQNAEVGDDVLEEDPTINKLQALVAKKLDVEAALFVPSGTAGNQIAIGVHTNHGDEIIVSESTHVIDHEQAAAAALWGAQVRAVTPRKTDWLTTADILPRIRVDNDVHIPRTGLIMLENPLAQGTVMPLETMQAVRRLANEHNVPIHLDGARLFSAALALGVDVSKIVAEVDSVMFCLSKNLGAPVGSMLCGSAQFISQAKRKRKIMGGGMRQAGVLAAPALIALEDGVARLNEDHENAKLLAKLLSDIPGVLIDLESVQTNMIFFNVKKENGRSAEGLVDYLNDHNFNVYPTHWWGIRIVICSRVNEDDTRALADAVRSYMN